MKQKIGIKLLLLILILALVGCGNANGDNTQGKDEPQTESQSQNEEDTSEEKQTEDESQSISSEEDIKVEGETETKLYAQTNLNVRKSPSTDGEKLGTLSQNQEVIALGEAVDGWQKIRYENSTAYVSANYLGKLKVEVEIPSANTTMQVDEITAADLKLPDDFDPSGIVIVIDAGHQGKGNSNKEPDGPGSSTLKAKVSSGTSGCVSKVPEYVLTLEVSLQLRDELKARGYQVLMIREDHNINISNSERAKFANNIGADAFVRIHANGSNDSAVNGVETLCQTQANPYNSSLYSASRKLSECILDEFVESTGAHKRRIYETDTMSGINWCQVPVTILEMGFMSNPEEDQLMNNDEYQKKMVEGIANGLDKYFGR